MTTIPAEHLAEVRAGLHAAGIADANDVLVNTIAGRIGATKLRDAIGAGLVGHFASEEHKALAAQVTNTNASANTAPATRDQKILAKMRENPNFEKLRGAAKNNAYNVAAAEVDREAKGELRGSAKIVAELMVRGTGNPLDRLAYANAISAENGSKNETKRVPLTPADIAEIQGSGLSASERNLRANTLSSPELHKMVRKINEYRGRLDALPRSAPFNDSRILKEGIESLRQQAKLRFGRDI